MQFDQNVLRLGSRIDKSHDAIIQRTLYELRAVARGTPGAKQMGHTMAGWKRQFTAWIHKFSVTLLPLINGKILTSDVLLEYGVISETQKGSLSAEGWSDGGEATDCDVPECKSIDLPYAPSLYSQAAESNNNYKQGLVRLG